MQTRNDVWTEFGEGQKPLGEVASALVDEVLRLRTLLKEG